VSDEEFSVDAGAVTESKGPRKSTRFRIESEVNDADALWRALLTHNDGGVERLKLGYVDLEPAQLVTARENDSARSEEPPKQPSLRMVLFAIKQFDRWVVSDPYKLPSPHVLGLADFDERFSAAVEAVSDGRLPKLQILHLLSMKNVDRVRVDRMCNNHRSKLEHAIETVVNTWRRSLGAPPVDLFTDDLRGPEAIAILRGRMLDGIACPVRGDWRDWLARAPGIARGALQFDIATSGDRREEVFRAFSKAAFTPSDVRLINGYATGLTCGLTGFAARLFTSEQRGKKALPMLYIPLHGRMREAPADSFSQLAYAIWRFYRRLALERPHNGEAAPPLLDEPRGHAATIAMICATHRLMAKHPAILLFDGYRAQRYQNVEPDYSLHNLLSAVAGDRLFDLIERLLMIPTPDDRGPLDVERFLTNRVIILSDAPLYSEADHVGQRRPLHPHPALRTISGVPFRIDPPLRPDLGALVRAYGFQAPEEIATIRREILPDVIDDAGLEKLFEDHSDALAERAGDLGYGSRPLSESILAVLSALLRIDSSHSIRHLSDDLGAALSELVTKHLVPALRNLHPDWLTMLELIAIAPGGLRPKTLVRIYEHYRQVMGEEPLGREAVNKAIADLLTALHGIIALRRSDHLDALRGRSIPIMSWSKTGPARREIASDRAIEFAFDEVRHLFLLLIRAKSPDHVARLHLLVAEEAYEQFIHLSRYDDLQSEPSLHRNSRLLAAIYHGAASLISHELETPKGQIAVGRLLPDDPVARWIKLTTDLYRRRLDNAPFHLLVRNYDAAHTKLDILLALARPQLCHGVTTHIDDWPLPGPDAPADAPNKGKDGRLALVQKWFARELRMAADGISRHPPFVWPDDFQKNNRLRLRRTINDLIDERGVKLSTGEARRIIKAFLAEFNGKDKGIGELVIDEVKRLLNNEIQEFGKRSELDLKIDELRDLIRFSPDKLKQLADDLSIYGELLGIHADREYGDLVRRGVRSDMPSDSGASGTGASESDEKLRKIVERFINCFAAIFIAEHIRQRLFWMDPRSARDGIGGHAARDLIRVSLKLERFRMLRQDEAQPQTERGWFWAYAHDVGDELARQLSRFPREQLALLILDSTAARYYLPRDDKRYGECLRNACEYLISAERLLLTLGMHSRLRQRFALERNKVMAESAERALNAGKLIESRRYLAICRADIETCAKLDPRNGPLWGNLVDSNRARLDRLSSALHEKEEAARAGLASIRRTRGRPRTSGA
jgi:hypothetical protein